MSFDQKWEECFKKNTHSSIWPWSDLVSFVLRHNTFESKLQILELGCGVGANIPFFRSLNIDYFAMDGSQYAIKKIKEKYPDIKKQILDNKIKNVDYVLYTHEHADQTSGMFELRPFFWKNKKKINIYADKRTLKVLMDKHDYCFIT